MRVIVSAIAFVLLPLAAFAQASGQGGSAAPPVFRWTGFYVGVSVDFRSTNAATTFDPLPSAAAFVNLMPTTLHPDPSGPSYQLTAGVNRHANKLIVGGEWDFSWFNPDGSVDVTPIIQNNGTPFPGAGALHAAMYTDWTTSARARVGMVFGRVFVFGAGGVAFGRVRYTAETDFRPVGTADYVSDIFKTRAGWTAGGGAEIRVSRRVSLRGEYRFLNLGSESATVDSTPPLPPFQLAYTWQTRITSYSAGIVIRF